MTTGRLPSEHPVLKELYAIHPRMAICLDSEDPNFGKCPEWATSSKAPCSIRPHLPDRAKVLLNDFRLLGEWPETNEFLASIETFLIASHCHKHGPRVTKAFQVWKLNHEVTGPPAAYQPPTVEDDGHEGDCKSPDVDFAKLSISPTVGEAKQPETKVEVDHQLDNARVESVTDEFSTMTITTSSHTKIFHNSDGTDATVARRIIGMGMAGLARKGSLRDHAPVFSEIYKPLSAVQQERGIVYVLGHRTNQGLFKIGWTRTTAKKRLNQSGNCYAADAVILHETGDGPFFAAHKAEKLAQTVLRHNNLLIRECVQCGGGHREWFRASRDMVIDTVKLMETFVRIPAYELTDGDVWKLSDAAYMTIKSMCDFSLAKLRSSITTTDIQTIDEATDDHSTRIKQETNVSVTETSAAPATSSVEEKLEDEPLASAENLTPRKDKQRSRRSFGTGVAIGARRITRASGKFGNGFSQLLNRSRENKPQPDSDGNPGVTDRSGSGSDNLRDAVIGVFWAMFPEDIKTRKDDDTNTPGFRRGVSWTKAVKQEFKAVVTDFEMEWNREREELEETPANKVVN
ncbi:hypothetical protein AK830_g952 [Neonectria ditissima]|uniref:Bacteriophage T5 Orf172 DNA-binding domain-containing protein n=1 Tax=Neonectria ditissima TaxID=78410 RepID=A0A0N8H8V9_9HYPO|nr:hypothetical protein AK830_g952 [Neonectria ditissima]